MTATSNILLIGMPGSGKSTTGIILAKLTGYSFLDTDLCIQERAGCTLQEIVNTHGHMHLRQLEEEVLCSLQPTRTVIATGGSAVYSTKAMQHLKQSSLAVFLHAELATLQARIDNYESRGLAKAPDQSFEELFQERERLYEYVADETVLCDRLSQEAVAAIIAGHYQAYQVD